MSIVTLNNRSINRSDTASSGQVWTATSATAADFQAAGIIEEVDMWVPTVDATNFTTIGVNDASSDLTVARHSGSNFTHKGTGMTTNNSYFSFPSTGYWYVSLKAQWRLESTTSCRGMTSRIDVSTDGGSGFNDNYGLSMTATHSFDSNNDFTSTDANCVVEPIVLTLDPFPLGVTAKRTLSFVVLVTSNIKVAVADCQLLTELL